MTTELSRKEATVTIAPSLICADLCNLERSVLEMEKLGVELLHVDLIDASFSPSMPLGIDIVRQLRSKSNLDFDVHLMVKDNEFFINEMLRVGVQQISFHYESATHVDRLLGLIRNGGAKAGIALTPSTPLTALEYVLDQCDFLLLMLINPGFAGSAGEDMVPYAVRKIRDAYHWIRQQGLRIPIEVDGRVSHERIPALVEAGADLLVAGSTSFFAAGNTMENNLLKMREAISDGLERRWRHEQSSE